MSSSELPRDNAFRARWKEQRRAGPACGRGLKTPSSPARADATGGFDIGCVCSLYVLMTCKPAATILHADLDAFYASVEQLFAAVCLAEGPANFARN